MHCGVPTESYTCQQKQMLNYSSKQLNAKSLPRKAIVQSSTVGTAGMSSFVIPHIHCQNSASLKTKTQNTKCKMNGLNIVFICSVTTYSSNWPSLLMLRTIHHNYISTILRLNLNELTYVQWIWEMRKVLCLYGKGSWQRKRGEQILKFDSEYVIGWWSLWQNLIGNR